MDFSASVATKDAARRRRRRFCTPPRFFSTLPHRPNQPASATRTNCSGCDSDGTAASLSEAEFSEPWTARCSVDRVVGQYGTRLRGFSTCPVFDDSVQDEYAGILHHHFEEIPTD